MSFRVTPPHNLIWSEKQIKLLSPYTIGAKRHVCMVHHATHNGRSYIKPIEPHYSSEFEDLFGFGLCCDGFNRDVVVDVTETNLAHS